MSTGLKMRVRDYSATILVSALSAGFGAVLIEASSILASTIADQGLDAVASVRTTLNAVTSVFFLIALYVASIVTANTVGTVITGRLREIALFRLIGASSRRLRAQIAREGLVCAVIGTVIGTVVVTILVFIALRIGVAQEVFPDADYRIVGPELALPIIVTILVGWLAAWVGSKRVLSVTPIQAVAADVPDEEPGVARARVIAGIVFLVIGLGILFWGVAIGMTNGMGVLVAVVGGLITFTGVLVASPVIMPALIGVAGALSGRSPAARIATQNGLRYPARTSRSMIGVVIGVTLVVMFAVAAATSSEAIYSTDLAQEEGGREAIDSVMQVIVAIFGSLLGFSAIIAAVGLVNNISLSVLQRQRELGLLRTLGFTAKQIRSMIVIEATQMSFVATIFGLLLGTLFGWAGAQSVMGSVTNSVTAPVVPLTVVIGALVLALLLSVISSILPARRATKISPIDALAVV